MNQNQIQQLTLHLSQALDQNYDVVNMEAVLSVICALEGTTITKDQLEATRLAKYINQLRRRTKNEQLARRAKSLLKKWREMVGIQHTVNDAQLIKSIAVINISETNITDNNNINEAHQYCSNQPGSTLPTNYRAISDLHSNIDLSNPLEGANDTPQQQTSFSNLIKHINIDESDESCKAIKNHRNSDQQKSATLNNELSSNSTLSFAVGASSDKLNDSSIVIDIVSDSDENDCGTQPTVQPKFTTSSSSLTFPTQVYPKPRKLKKDKKRKEKEQNFSLLHETHSQKSKNYFKKSKILSLSNSSMSSILSGDAISMSANSQFKSRTTCDLTFAGRFKSVSQVSAFNNENSNDPKTVCQKNEVEQPILKTIYEDYINNDSSTSCSRLSSFEEQSQQIHSKSFIEPNRPEQLLSQDIHKVDFQHENLRSEVPKKRGRKKGSKGVDSVIAKESSLSQQIFFGSGVKKVKTTKELFNEIQSRKLSISYNRNAAGPPATSNKLSNDPTQQNRESTRSFIARPTSSCSGSYSTYVYIHKIQNTLIKINFFFFVDVGNTDSDTITSEPSHDSIKSGEIKRSTSLESISSLMQAPSSFKNSIVSTITTKINHNNDVTTELMHLVNGLSSPQSVGDTVKLYQAQIVPCTCEIQEETKMIDERQSISQLKIETEETDAIGDYIKRCPESAFEGLLPKPNNNHRAEDDPNLKPPKPIKSIFDLDFDDDDDPLHSIMDNVLKVDPTDKIQVSKDNNDNDNIEHVKLQSEVKLSHISGYNIGNDHDQDDIDNGEKVLETLSIYTVVEDPNCVAKQRFVLQTNQVTNYHINALHNLYVPNINGNWSTIEKELSSSILNSTISQVFQNQIDSYAVSDGADVVPKYGSLTCDERIPKDLSSLKFNKNFAKKIRKLREVPPFLGIAKCLPSCRLSAKRSKLDAITSTLNLSGAENVKPIKDSSGALEVDIDVPIDQKHDQSFNGENFVKSSNDNSTLLSCDLLKFTNNPETTCQADGVMTLGSHQTTSEQIDRDVVERNRKKRRKAPKLLSEIDAVESEHEDNVTKPLIKRFKISMNGNVAAPQKILMQSKSTNNSSEDEASEYLSTGSGYHYYQKSSTVSDNEVDEHDSYSSQSFSSVDSIALDEDDGHLENDNDNGDNNGNEEYAIVQKPIMGGAKNQNHIVLTIKKTPNKVNSPASSTSAISPTNINSSVGVAFSDAETDIVQNGNFDIEKIPSNPHTCLHKCYRNRCQSRRYRYRHTRKHPISRKEETIDLELKHLFNDHNIARTIQSKAKAHRKLFFSKELYREDNVGRKERIINYSSSSSNYDEESEPDQIKRKKIKIDLKNNFELKIETDKTSAASVENLWTAKCGQDDDLYFSSSDESVRDELLFSNQFDDDIKLDIIQRSESPTVNNGMLLSFNSIYANDIKDVTQLQSLQIENCDDVNICYNSNNISLIKPNSLDSLTKPINDDALKEASNIDSPNWLSNYNNFNYRVQPHIEYKTGIRAIVEDDTSLFKVQHFKEWHEVLQLQSYNNEPLIVLPYVVLE
ncbi:hypothetical protein KR044_001245 [Drosophila immigrans]|nr:hypothetical protein KR044_001245 [Drosophila immigrans]